MSNDSMFDPQGDLQENIIQLVGHDEAISGRPAFNELDRQLLRISTLPSIKRVSDQDDGEDRDATTRDLLRGLCLQHQTLAYIILSQEKKIKVMFGLAHAEPSCLERILRGTYPGISFEELAPEPITLELEGFPFCAAIRGVPSPKKENGMDRLLYGLGGNCWAYVVYARPLDANIISKTMETFAMELQRVKNAFLRSYTAEQDNNPLAQYYFDLLRAALEQYKVGQIQGCWETETFFLSSSEALLASGMTILTSIFCGDQSLPTPLRIYPCTDDNRTSIRPTILNSRQLASLVHLPSAEMPGYQVVPSTSFASALPQSRGEKSLAIGKIIQAGRKTGQWAEIGLEDLTKHAFITGVTGLGKTETCHFILDQVWREYGIPYLVIEPAKKEYSRLRNAAGHEMLQVFSPGGAEGTAPLRLNPFEIPQKTTVQTHIDFLRCLFNNSLAGLYPPMPYLLEDALYRVYQKRGWNIAGRQGRAGTSFPTLNDFCMEVEEVALSSGYDKEVTQNVSTSLRVRLNSWRIGIKGLMLNTSESTPFDTLLARPAVIELSDITDPEVVSFVMGLVLIRLYEHVAENRSEAKLGHVLLIEEAHRLLARGLDNTGNIEVSNVRGQAVESFCNMLTEVRAYGEGLIIVDQSPTKLHADAIKGTNLKIVHRLVAQDDRSEIGGAANMNEDQQRYLAVLQTGDAVVYAEGFQQPYLVNIPEFRRYAISNKQDQG